MGSGERIRADERNGADGVRQLGRKSKGIAQRNNIVPMGRMFVGMSEKERRERRTLHAPTILARAEPRANEP